MSQIPSLLLMTSIQDIFMRVKRWVWSECFKIFKSTIWVMFASNNGWLPLWYCSKWVSLKICNSSADPVFRTRVKYFLYQCNFFCKKNFCICSIFFLTFIFRGCILYESRGGAEIGRQARLRILCPVGRVGSSPILRSKEHQT